MEKALRKAKSDLTLSGVGSVVFGIWYFVKTILYNLFARNYLNDILGLGETDRAVRLVLAFLWLMVSALMMVLYLYVGLCAVSEGTGKSRRRKMFYLILAGALLLDNGYSLVSSLRNFDFGETSLLDQVCDVMMDAARLANMAALLRAALRTRKLTRVTEQEVSGHAD